ncbi:MAG: N-acetylmuramoyl-L-alanine amidase [Syntrophales bacterium]|nr:N-acetylmuramoyl-L-alanine amidase [Syntrophales bacterium]
MRLIIKYIVAFFLLFAILSFPAQGETQTKIINIRHWAAPDHTRIVIDTTEDPDYEVNKDGKMLFLELEDTVYSKALSRLIRLKKPGIDKIVVTPRPEDRVLIELHLTEHTETKVFKLQKFEEKPYRIVVDIVLPEMEKRETEERERVKVALKKKIVVIDPGHGGDDPGAVGKRGTYEKDVVLILSRKIRDYLNKKEGYRAFLTRDGDYYVAFKKRLKIAREYQADLFISIHADAEKSRQASGASVYALSLRSASSEAARILARNENLADIVGGVANGEVTKEESDPIILNMVQNNTMNSSKTLGAALLRNMGAVNRIKFATVQEAPLMVLKLPEIPSVLIETAYISNPREERLLRSPKFQREMASTISQSAVNFLEHQIPAEVPSATSAKSGEVKKMDPENPPVKKADDEIASETKVQEKKTKVVIYTVNKGNSLERIARKYGVTAAAIMELNNIKPDTPLYVNRKLKISVAVEEDNGKTVKKADKGEGSTKIGTSKKLEKKESFALYRVKKDESLDTIARNNGTTIARLMKLNSLKLKDKIYAGRNIKIPAVKSEEDTDEKGEIKKKEESREMPAGKVPAVYVVRKNDTLRDVAKKHGVSLQSLLKLNNMKLSDPLFVGRRIKIAENIEKEKTVPKIYTVKKGDTLDTIARKHKTTIAVLKDLNSNKKLKPLLVDQKLKIPVRSQM